MPSRSQGWQGEDVKAVYFPQWKPLAAHCEKPEPLRWDWRKHELQCALWANSSGEVLGLHRRPVPLQIPHDHLAVIYTCLSMSWLHNDKQVCVCMCQGGLGRGANDITFCTSLLEATLLSCQSPFTFNRVQRETNLKLPFIFVMEKLIQESA